MNSHFSIDILNHRTDRMCGLLEITPKVTMTRETLSQLVSILQTRLHYLLTHSVQEGESDEKSFCDIVFPAILRVVEEVGNYFGEDATVILDANLNYYGPEAMSYHYQCGLELLIGTHVPHNNVRVWKFLPFSHDGLDQLESAFGQIV